MSEVSMFALLSVGLAILLIALALPMVFEKVPMNSLYGARFKASFKSERNWYVINAYGGKVLCVAALPIAACGVAGFFLGTDDPGWYIWGNVGVWLGSVLTAAGLTYRKAREVDREERG